MNAFIISRLTVLAFILSIISAPVLAGPTVYIPLGSGNVVIAVDASSDKIIATYTGVMNAHGLVATPDGEYLVAGSLNETPLKKGQSPGTPNSKLFLIHPAHGHVMSTIPVAGWTHHQAITPDGRYVISTHGLRGYISVLDMQDNKIVRRVKTGMVPNYTLISKDGAKAYVSNTGSNSISEIDLKTWNVVRTLQSGPAPEHMTFAADQKVIYVTNPRAGKVSAVSVATGKIFKTYMVGKSVHGLDMGDDGVTLFVSSKKSGLVAAINTKTGKRKVLKLSPQPYHLNTIHGTGKIYVSSRKKPVIWVLSQADLKLITTIKLPAGEAHQMAIVK